MRVDRRTAPVLLLVFGSMALSGAGCTPDAGSSGSNEILATEEIGGAIDVELSTQEDPRGPRWTESGLVLPPGFPAQLPIPAGASVIDQGMSAEGQSFVVFGMPTAAASLIASWTSLLEAEGWSVNRSGASGIRATLADSAITATATETGSGSRLRITY